MAVLCKRYRTLTVLLASGVADINQPSTNVSHTPSPSLGLSIIMVGGMICGVSKVVDQRGGVPGESLNIYTVVCATLISVSGGEGTN